MTEVLQSVEVSYAPIIVERDETGLQQALLELFEEGYVHSQNEKMVVPVDLPERTLAEGYYKRALYLLNLQRSIEAGCNFSAESLLHVDVLGLRAVKLARNEYEFEHPTCPYCGTRLQNRFVATCHGCMKSLRGKN